MESATTMKLTKTQEEVLKAHKLGRTPMYRNAPMSPISVAITTAALVEMGLMPRLAAPPLGKTLKETQENVIGALASLKESINQEALEAPRKPVRARREKVLPRCPVVPNEAHRGFNHSLITDEKEGGTVGVLFIENPPPSSQIGIRYHIYTITGRYLGFTLSQATASGRIFTDKRRGSLYRNR